MEEQETGQTGKQGCGRDQHPFAVTRHHCHLPHPSPGGRCHSPRAAWEPFLAELQAEGPEHRRHIPEAKRMGHGTAGKGSPIQRPRVLVHTWAQELRGTAAEARGAEHALAAHRGHWQHVSPASRDRGQCVCVGEHWQHSLRTRVCGGGSWQRAGCEHTGYWGWCTVPAGDRRSGVCCRCPAGVLLPEEAGTPLTRSTPCRDPRSLRLPKPAPGQDVAALLQRMKRVPSHWGQARPEPHGGSTGPPGLCEAPAHPRLL